MLTADARKLEHKGGEKAIERTWMFDASIFHKNKCMSEIKQCYLKIRNQNSLYPQELDRRLWHRGGTLYVSVSQLRPPPPPHPPCTLCGKH